MSLQERTIRVLRWSERYTKTDMVYLAQVGYWNNLGVGFSTILTLGLSVAFANLVPRETYGSYQYLLSLSAIIGALTLNGMSTAVTQSVARGYEGDLRASVRIQLIWNIVPALMGLIGAAYYFANNNATAALGLAIIAVFAPLVSAFNTYGAFLGGRRDFRRSFLYMMFGNALYYPLMMLALLFVKDAVFLIFINMAASAGAAWWLYRHTVQKLHPNDRTDPKTIPYGMHLSVMNAFGTIITQIDSVLVFHFLGAVPLAIYSFATLIPERFASLLNFVGAAAFPKFANRTLDELRSSILPQTMRIAALGTVCAILYAALSPLLFRLLFPGYMDAVRYTQWYSLIIVMLTANLASAALQAKRRRSELYMTSIVNPVMLIALQIPLLLAYGIMGMIAARIISDALGIALSLLLLFRAHEEATTS